MRNSKGQGTASLHNVSMARPSHQFRAIRTRCYTGKFTLCDSIKTLLFDCYREKSGSRAELFSNQENPVFSLSQFEWTTAFFHRRKNFASSNRKRNSNNELSQRASPISMYGKWIRKACSQPRSQTAISPSSLNRKRSLQKLKGDLMTRVCAASARRCEWAL